MVTRPFVLITTAALVMFIYIGVMTPLLPRLIEEQLGGNEIDIGLNLATFSIAAVLIRPQLGRFAEQHGLRSTMVFGALLAAVATSACALIDSRWGLLPLRCLQGIGEAAVFVGAATSISDLAPSGRGAEAASYFSVAVFGGLGIGPVIGESVIGRDRFDAGLLTAAGFAALASVLALLTPAGMRHQQHGGERGPRFHRAAIPTGLVLALGVGGFVTFTAFMPEYSVSVGLSGSKWVFATYAAVCLIIRIVAATVPDRIGHANAVTIALSFMMVGLAMLFFLPWPVGVFASTVIVAIGISFNYPGLMAMVVDTVPEHERVRAISTFTMFFEIGTASGALLLGTMADLSSKRTAFLGGAAFCAAGLVVLWKVAVPRSRLHVTV
ncbi:MAG TPA: MFS transporter [Ilumatobacteraceae bacterium]|nr:MFS transporter [Ilumatobacteraceae bacterium]